jgi:hypothetical protein
VEAIALVVSVVALLSSIGLPLLLDRRQVPRIRLVTQRALVFAPDGGEAYVLHVFNGGRFSVDILGWGMMGEGHEDRSRHPGFANGLPGGGPESLPTTVPPFSSVGFWRTREVADPALRNAQHGATDVQRLRGYVDLSTGWRLHARNTVPVFGRPHRLYDPDTLLARLRRRIFRREPTPQAAPHKA